MSTTDTTKQPDPTQPEGTKDPQAPEAPPERVIARGPEDDALEAAEAKLAEAEKAKAAPAADAAEPAKPTDGAKPPEGDKPKEGVKPQVKMVPEGALIATNKALRETARRAAELEGENRVLRSMAKVPEGEKPKGDKPEDTPAAEERITAIQKQREELADQFDKGDLTMRQMREQDAVLEAEQWKIRREEIEAAIPQPQALDHQQVVQAVTAEQQAAELETKYPQLADLTEEDTAPFTKLVQAQADIEGKPIKGIVDLRARVVEAIAKQKGWSPVGSANSQPGQQTPQPLSPQAQARETKLGLAASLPPDVSKMGAPASGVERSDADHTAATQGMTEDQKIAYFDAQPALLTRTTGRSKL